MSSETPPTYYFSGIKFNPSFYQSTSGDYLTLATAKSSFLTYPTAQGIETISTLKSSSIDSSTPTSGELSLAPSQTTGILNIGTGERTTEGAINIGTGSASANVVTIGSETSSTVLNGTSVKATTKLTTPRIDSLATDASIEIGTNQKTGLINIGTPNTRTSGGINMGTACSLANTINIGTVATSTIGLRGLTVNVTTKLTTPTLDCLTDAGAGSTSLSIGPSAKNGNIVIGAALSAGDISIAAAQASGGTVTIGSANTATTLNGTCTFSNNITLSTTPSLPTINQIGYTVFLLTDFAIMASNTANVVTNISSASIPAGTFIVHFSGGGAFSGVYNIGISTTSATYTPRYTKGATTVVAFNNNHTKPTMTVVIQNTAATTWYLVHGSPSAAYDAQRINWYYTRIA